MTWKEIYRKNQFFVSVSHQIVSGDALTFGGGDTMVVPLEQLDSVEHKLNRMREQQSFCQENRYYFSLLTSREVEVLTLLSKGLNNPKIAESLSISRRTVEQHRKNLNRKLSVNSLAELINYALAFDLI